MNFDKIDLHYIFGKMADRGWKCSNWWQSYLRSCLKWFPWRFLLVYDRFLDLVALAGRGVHGGRSCRNYWASRRGIGRGSRVNLKRYQWWCFRAISLGRWIRLVQLRLLDQGTAWRGRIGCRGIRCARRDGGRSGIGWGGLVGPWAMF